MCKKKKKTGSRTQNKYVRRAFSFVFRRIMICALKATIPQRPAERCV